MDLRHITADPSPVEREAVDAVLTDAEFDAPIGNRTAVGGRTASARRDLLLPAFHALNDVVGRITEGGLGYVCERLTVPPAEGYGVATFYDLFAVGDDVAAVVRVCDDVGSDPDAVEELIAGLDGVTVERCSCLGHCDTGSAAIVHVPGRGPVEVPAATADRISAVIAGGSPERSVASLGAIGDRVLLARAGSVDPSSIEDYLQGGGYRALAAAVTIGSGAVFDILFDAGLRGRGGAGFLTAHKWKAVAGEVSTSKYVVCNADESEPGTFKDRTILELDPFAVIEGMTLAGLMTGAGQGFIYVRGEYALARRRIEHAIERARSTGHLGPDIMGTGRSFDIEVRRGAGAYVCGEETALFNSIEGLRGEPRAKPPFPTSVGLFDAPTVINNVETLIGAVAAVAGTGTGTKLFPISGAVHRPGLYEAPLGTTISELIAAAGGATGSVRAVLVGGAAGRFVDGSDLDVALDDTPTEVPLGSGALIVFDESVDMNRVVRRIARFFREESCGQCVPCRIGTVRQLEALDRHLSGVDERALLDDVSAVLRDASICGLGQLASEAVQSALDLGLIGTGGGDA
jgi:NADH-quinone oxidoreductase subunit F